MLAHVGREFVIKAICHLLFIATGGRRVLFCLYERERTTLQSSDFSGGIRCSGSRVDRISLVIYSTRVGDVSPSFAVILAVPPYHEDTRHEDKAGMKRGLKRGKEIRTGERYDKYNIFPAEIYAYEKEAYKLYKLLFTRKRIFTFCSETRNFPLEIF